MVFANLHSILCPCWLPDDDPQTDLRFDPEEPMTAGVGLSVKQGKRVSVVDAARFGERPCHDDIRRVHRNRMDMNI